MVDARRELICFGEDWDRHPSTGQFLVRHLLDGFRVIWINSVGWRTPRLRACDVTRALRKVRAAARGAARPHPNLVVYTPLVVPWYRFGAVRRFNAGLLLGAVRGLARRHGFSRYTLMTTYPAVADVFRRMREVPRVYYCTDEYATLPGLHPERVRSLEAELLTAVDLVVTTSTALYEAKSAMHPRVAYLPHAVDFELFAKAADLSTPIPDDLKGLPRPIVGFHGLIQDLIDPGIIDVVARRRPDWSIVLIGRRNFEATSLPQRPNIYYLGERPYRDLPGYLRGFDACLIPYKQLPRVTYMNPVKLREYLASGKPIVSTPLPEVAKFGELVRIAESGDEFVVEIERCLAEDGSLRARRMASVRDQTWTSRAAEFAALLPPS
jgi:glycosyltransferase involved in cell wall biosynthesis